MALLVRTRFLFEIVAAELFVALQPLGFKASKNVDIGIRINFDSRGLQNMSQRLGVPGRSIGA